MLNGYWHCLSSINDKNITLKQDHLYSLYRENGTQGFDPYNILIVAGSSIM